MKTRFSPRFLFYFLLLTTLFAFSACSNKEQENKIKDIKLSNNISLSIPESWKVLSMSKGAEVVKQSKEKVAEILGDELVPKEYDLLLAAFSENQKGGVMVIAYGGETNEAMKVTLETAKDPEKVKSIDAMMKAMISKMLEPAGFSNLIPSPVEVSTLSGFADLLLKVSGKDKTGKDMNLILHQIPLSKITLQIILSSPLDDNAIASQVREVEKSIKITE